MIDRVRNACVLRVCVLAGVESGDKSVGRMSDGCPISTDGENKGFIHWIKQGIAKAGFSEKALFV
jgi:hypothetical protein